ncbi:MAG TPA: alpha-amylase family glycosyl hydrolase [Beutenbergiaceae bacterium]|nr:alpha-amylase family glycosyl hydrolase [Beutenbergiaceae bacterium]
MAGREAKSRIKDVYSHPVGRDAIDKVLLQLGRSRRWVTNPLVANLPLGVLGRLARPILGPGFVGSLLEVLTSHPEVADSGGAAPKPPGVGEPARAGSMAGPAMGDPAGGETPVGGPASGGRAWWRSAVFYQVYPRSFADDDGDGVGDLRGIISRLDHLADLGVDCLWLSPIFDSPNEDMGYDVRDYRAVQSEMGTLEDLDELIGACHQRGMRIILDLVVNHTSAEHSWFRAAIADPDGPYGNYYHLRPGAPGEDGTGPPPNNWTSFFGGSAWRWIPEARRWALHLFAPGQMDLNWDNPAVREEVADIVRWWGARGIDGFRLDVINYISKRVGLPDGDEGVGRLMGFVGIEHYFFGPQLHEYLRELRARGFTRRPTDPPPASTVHARRGVDPPAEPLPPDPAGVMVGETPGVGVEMGKLLSSTGRAELDLVFNFDVLEPPGRIRWDDYRYDLRYLKRYYQDYLDRTGPADRIALFLENHDNPRMVSKVLGPDAADAELRTAVAKALATIQLTLPGTPFLFQGQEVAAINQDFTSVEQLRDVEARNRIDELRAAGHSEPSALRQVLPGARDHARAPMRWEPGAATGFTAGIPWQVGAEDSSGFTVAEQAAEPDSVLAFYRSLIRLRRAHPALADGEVTFLYPRRRNYFAWLRTLPGERTWLVEVNLSGRPIRRPRRSVPAADAQVVLSTGDHRSRLMAPYEVVIARLGAES